MCVFVFVCVCICLHVCLCVCVSPCAHRGALTIAGLKPTYLPIDTHTGLPDLARVDTSKLDRWGQTVAQARFLVCTALSDDVGRVCT